MTGVKHIKSTCKFYSKSVMNGLKHTVYLLMVTCYNMFNTIGKYMVLRITLQDSLNLEMSIEGVYCAKYILN